MSFNEGLINFPDGYQDRTVNVFVPPVAEAPAFNISRDTLNPGEALAAYIDRQLALMEKHLKGWKQSARNAVTLGDNLYRVKSSMPATCATVNASGSSRPYLMPTLIRCWFLP